MLSVLSSLYTLYSVLSEEQLGISQFGYIYKGAWSGHSGFKQDVAVKMLRADTTASDRLRLLQEVTIMAQFRHPNVVALYGISDQQDSSVSSIIIIITRAQS